MSTHIRLISHYINKYRHNDDENVMKLTSFIRNAEHKLNSSALYYLIFPGFPLQLKELKSRRFREQTP